MADQKISQLAENTTPGDNDVLPMVIGGVTVKVKKINFLSGLLGKDTNGNIRAGQSTFGAVYLGYIANPALFGDYNAYIGFNVERFQDTDLVWKWRTRTDTVRNGAFLQVVDSGGVLKTANIPTTGTSERILTDAEMLALLQTPGETKADKDLTIFTYTASHTLVLANRGGMVRMNVASANTLTVPPNSAVAFPVGTKMEWSQPGAGQTTFVAGSGVTITPSYGGGLKSAGIGAGGTLIKVGTDAWELHGNIRS